MKLAVHCLCFLHFVLLSFGLDTYISLSRSKSFFFFYLFFALIVRTLFARRALYEQQKIHETVTFNIFHLTPPPPLKYTSSLSNFQKKCSLLGQSCVPLCGCCDPCTTCHCRFFNAICYCRRAEQARPRCGSKKTAKRRKSKTQL
uniref:Agouti domain-containing protein n=1 Tax=Poecilia reticulata TaxID=8081 RepID=A0A3P9NMP2_POERE